MLRCLSAHWGQLYAHTGVPGERPQAVARYPHRARHLPQHRQQLRESASLDDWIGSERRPAVQHVSTKQSVHPGWHSPCVGPPPFPCTFPLQYRPLQARPWLAVLQHRNLGLGSVHAAATHAPRHLALHRTNAPYIIQTLHCNFHCKRCTANFALQTLHYITPCLPSPLRSPIRPCSSQSSSGGCMPGRRATVLTSRQDALTPSTAARGSFGEVFKV